MNRDSKKSFFVASVVEDEPATRQAVKLAIEEVAATERMECRIDLFRNPSEAVAAADVLVPDMVVMDFQKADGRTNGWDAARLIQAKSCAEIIIYTGNSREARKRASSSPTADASIAIYSKPATHAEVCGFIREALRRRIDASWMPKNCTMDREMGLARERATSSSEDVFLAQLEAHGRKAI